MAKPETKSDFNPSINSMTAASTNAPNVAVPATNAAGTATPEQLAQEARAQASSRTDRHEPEPITPDAIYGVQNHNDQAAPVGDVLGPMTHVDAVAKCKEYNDKATNGAWWGVVIWETPKP